MKKIALFTGTRAEYGLMRTLIKKLNKDNHFEFNLLISSTHLNSRFGNTIEEIKNDGISTEFVLPIDIATKKKSDMGLQTAEIIKQVTLSFIILGSKTFCATTLLVAGSITENFI